MTVSLFSILAGVGCLLVPVATLLFSPFYRRIRPADDADGGDAGQTADAQTGGGVPVSIIMAAHNDADALERNIPLFMEQKYGAGFEMIVVDESSTDETASVLNRLSETYPNLYVTFIPDTSHHLSRRKLALTLAVKAARHEWLILTDASCHPSTDQWLARFAANFDNDCQTVLGLTVLSEEAPGRWRFERLLNNCYQMSFAESQHTCRYDGRALAFRRSTFMASNGFLKNLLYLRGEYDFIANEYSQIPVEGSDATSRTFISASHRLIQERPDAKAWRHEHLDFLEIRHLLAHGGRWRALHQADQTYMFAGLLALTAAAVYGLTTADWLLAAVATVSLLATFAVRARLAIRAAEDYGDSLAPLMIPVYELTMPFRQLYMRLLHCKTDKFEFIRR